MLPFQNKLFKERIILIGSADSPRIQAFQETLKSLRRQPAFILTYKDIVENSELLQHSIKSGDYIKFESPDRDIESLRALYKAGISYTEDANYTALCEKEIDRALTDKGRLLPPAQLFFGLIASLETIEKKANFLKVRTLSHSGDIANMFDKTACLTHLKSCKIPVPFCLGAVTSFDDLANKMRENKKHRVFVKLRHGSAGAAMIALASGPHGQMIAYCTADIASNGHIYTTRRMRKLENYHEIKNMINRLQPMGLHVESWLPKAALENMVCDLRIIVIAGEPYFFILRQSPHPMTNLHLGGKRQSVEILKERMKEEHWESLKITCRNVAKAFPHSFMMGIDLAVLNNFRDHVVLEVNAFGDFIKGAKYQGCNPHEWQILHWFALKGL